MFIILFILFIGIPLIKEWIENENYDYYGAAEPPVRCGVSHLSELTEPLLEIAI